MLSVTLISFFAFFSAIIVNFFANSQLANSTARPPVVVRPVNNLVFMPCFRLTCFENLGCFEPYLISAYISAPPLSVCPQNPNEMGVRFLVLASERVGGKYDNFLSLSEIKPGTKVAFMVHGILSEYDEYIYVLPGYLLLKEYDYVIFVEWSIPADPFVFKRIPIPGLSFFVTHANVEVVGRMTANIIQKLRVERNIQPKDVRVDGFSAGGNMVEFIGEWARYRHKISIGKCTAIEMSGAPYFFTNKRLPHRGICEVLDCVHATYNPKIPLLTELVAATAHFGAFESNCDSDYYINYPFALIDQPGCVGIYFCSHLYGLIFYSSALMKCNYPFTNCDLYSIFFSNPNGTTRLDTRDHGPLGSVCVRSGNKPLSHC